MNLHDANRGVRKNRKAKRIGRGTGSGVGKTSGRGHKGQGQNAGWSRHPGFEGGQMPAIRRIPKRGFNNRWALVVKSINVGQLDAVFADGDEITPEALAEKHLVRGRYDILKVLGNGSLGKKLKISAHRFSQSAREKIEQAGGQVIELPGKAPVQGKTAQAD